jgi:hypothetical protein
MHARTHMCMYSDLHSEMKGRGRHFPEGLVLREPALVHIPEGSRAGQLQDAAAEAARTATRVRPEGFSDVLTSTLDEQLWAAWVLLNEARHVVHHPVDNDPCVVLMPTAGRQPLGSVCTLGAPRLRRLQVARAR